MNILLLFTNIIPRSIVYYRGNFQLISVSSFAGRKRDSANWGDLEYDVHGHGHGHGVDDRPEWERHTSAWKIKKKRASIDHILGEENENGVASLNDEEQEIGEGTRLLSEDIEQRDARREKIARLALNSA
jgi:hypothetical protein